MSRRLLALVFALLLLGNLAYPGEGLVLHCLKTGQEVTPHWEATTKQLDCCPDERQANSPHQWKSSCCEEQWRSGKLTSTPPSGKYSFDFVSILISLPEFRRDTSATVCPRWDVGDVFSPRGPPRFLPLGRAPPTFS